MPRILVAGGVLLLGIYVALDPEDVWAKLTGRGALYSGNTLLIAAAALVILGLVNVARVALSDQARPDRQPAIHAVGPEHQGRPGAARAGQGDRVG